MRPTFQRNSHNGAPILNHPFKITKKGHPARVMYGRPSNFGAQVENRFNLERWNERRVLLGAARINLAGVDELDPDDPDQASQLDGLVGEAKHAAGASLYSERGIAAHKVTEYADRNEESPISVLQHAEELGMTSAVIDALMSAYDRLMRERMLKVLAVEATVVDDRWRLAGTLDRIVRLETDLLFTDGSVIPAGDVVVLDVKGGRLRVGSDGAPDYWNSYAVQIASYSHSVPYIFGESPWDEARDEWPWEVSQRHGLILHLDIGNAIEEDVATAQLFHVDLVAGHRAGNLCRAARDWQSSRGVVQEFTGHPIAVNVR